MHKLDNRVQALVFLRADLIQLHQEVDLVVVSMKALNTLVSDMVMILSHITETDFLDKIDHPDNGDTI